MIKTAVRKQEITILNVTVCVYDFALENTISFISFGNSKWVTGTIIMSPTIDTNCSKHSADCFSFKFEVPLITGIESKNNIAKITLFLIESLNSFLKNSTILLDSKLIIKASPPFCVINRTRTTKQNNRQYSIYASI